MALVSNIEFKYKLDIWNSNNRITTTALTTATQRTSKKRAQNKAAEFTIRKSGYSCKYFSSGTEKNSKDSSMWQASSLKNSNISYGFLQTRYHSSNRRQYIWIPVMKSRNNFAYNKRGLIIKLARDGGRGGLVTYITLSQVKYNGTLTYQFP